MAKSQTKEWQETWYSKEHGLTPESLINRIKKEKRMDIIETGVILSDLYTNEDSERLSELRKAVIGMEQNSGVKPKKKAESFADCKLFWLCQIANGYLTEINNISCKYIQYNAFTEGKVTDFYKKTTGFDPIEALPLANDLFEGKLHPDSKSKLEKMAG